eukprot:7000879-Prymnesium_polylepis.1
MPTQPVRRPGLSTAWRFARKGSQGHVRPAVITAVTPARGRKKSAGAWPRSPMSYRDEHTRKTPNRGTHISRWAPAVSGGGLADVAPAPAIAAPAR